MTIFAFCWAYLIGAIFVNFAVQGIDDRPRPLERRSVGIMLLWPLFVIRFLLFCLAWLARNISQAVIEAFNRLTEI